MDGKKIIEWLAIGVAVYLAITWISGLAGSLASGLGNIGNSGADYQATIFYGPSPWWGGGIGSTPVRWGAPGGGWGGPTTPWGGGPPPRINDGRTWGTGGY